MAYSPKPVYISNYGAWAGNPDNRNAIAAAISYVANTGGTITLDVSGTYTVIPTSADISRGYVFDVPNNVTIDLSSASVIIQLGGTDQCSLFRFLNPNNCYIKNGTLAGNNVATFASTAGPILFIADGTATGPMKNFGAPCVTVTNWKQSDGIKVQNGSSYPMSNINVDNVYGISLSGNQFSSTTLCSFIHFIGQLNNSAGTISQVSARGGMGDGTYITTYLVGFNVSDVIVDHGYFTNFGAMQDPSILACHAVLFYEQVTGFETRSSGNKITNCYFKDSRSNHAYMYKTDNYLIDSNIFDGIPDLAGNPSEPPSGVRINVASGTCSNNLFINSYNPDITITTLDETSSYSGVNVIENNTAVNSLNPSNGRNISLSISGDATNSTKGTAITYLKNNTMQRLGGTTGQPVSIITTDTNGIGSVYFQKNSFYGSGFCTQAGNVAGTGTAQAVLLSFDGDFVQGKLAGFFINNCTNSLIFSDVVVDGATAGTSGYPVQLNASTDVRIDGMIIQNYTGDYTTDWRSANGTVQGVQIKNCTLGVGFGFSGALGLALPTWGAQQGSFVQNLAPVEAGSAASKYMVTGWTNVSGMTTWLPNRTLTGN